MTHTTRGVVTHPGGGLKYPSRMDDALHAAIDEADLPALVGHYYPDSGAQPGRKGVFFAVWRGDEHESFSLFRSDAGCWLYHDHRTRETGNAFRFLTDICGLSKAEAAKTLKRGETAALPGAAPVAKRRRKASIKTGDAVYEGLWRAVNDGRIVGFKHPLSQATLSPENALICVRGALETPSARDSQRILGAAHGALKELARRKKKERREGKPVAFYDYTDARGKLLYQVVRFEPKSFSQRRPYEGGWAWGLTEGSYVRSSVDTLVLEDRDTPADAERVTLAACTPILYHLPRVIAAAKQGFSVHIVEGEEDVHALGALGLTATCNSGGAGKWDDAYAEVFRGGVVFILPDNDEAGEAHALRVLESLTGVAKRVRIVDLPGLAPAGDVRDWLGTHDRQQLIVELARLGPRR